MSFGTWIAIAIALVIGVVGTSAERKKTDRKYTVALIWFVIAVILFFIWWFTR
ncbi:hypothetical protein [Radiobacillus deserti]|uniref:hypothetical protein n=1 Tax=Radiobacillus deserti TaxID=2594883 RepID=UPI001315808E|nr:hypothetical protein [Radiobacillus deserti]